MRHLIASFILLVACASPSHAEAIYGTTSLPVGNARTDLQAFDESRVNVLWGGTVSLLNLYDSSSGNVYPGGNVSWLYAHNNSTVSVNLGGVVSWLYMNDSSSAIVNAGAELSHFYNFDQASALVNDGTITFLGFFGDAVGEIRGGNISYLKLSRTAYVDLYGYDFQFDGHQLQGRWSNGTPFSFWINQVESPGEAPSPSPISLPANLELHVVQPPIRM